MQKLLKESNGILKLILNNLKNNQMTKETLEEAAENYANKKGHIPTTELEDAIFKQGFLDGAQWQQERMYIEEDMKRAIEKTVEQCNKMMQESYGLLEIDVDYIFEQFKKK